MSKLFLQILNMSFTAGIVIVLLLFVRILLASAPKSISYAMWGVVLFRLVCPFSFESRLSLLGTKAVPIPPNIGLMQTPTIDTGITFINNSVNAVLPNATPYASINPMQVHIAIGVLVWIVGIASLLLYSVVSLARLQARLRDAVHEEDNIYRSSAIDTPFVIGLFRPRIYLPASLGDEERRYILLHEQMHLRRLDHVVRLASFGVLCLHWFNPLAWVAFFASGKDMEMSCDEAVVNKLGAEVKKDYSSSLLTLATGRRLVGGTPLAFGEGDTKSRIKNVLNYKKPAFWVVLVAVVAAAALGIGLMANPVSARASMAWVQNLTVTDVQSIELVTMLGEQYVKFEPSQHESIVKLLNQSRGRYIAEPEPLAGGSIAYYINTTDGKRHWVENVGNVYLVIDGESYDAPSSWLRDWEHLDGGELPEDFDYSFTADTSTADKLWEARTPYVGNNVAVSKLVGLLPVPNGLQYDHIELHTSSQPYEIEIVYGTDTEVMDQYDSMDQYGSDDTPLAATIYNNAMLLLALVDNVDTITTTLSSGNGKMVFSSEREWVDQIVGGDVRGFAESAKKLDELLELQRLIAWLPNGEVKPESTRTTIPIDDLPNEYPASTAIANGDYVDLHGDISNNWVIISFMEAVKLGQEAFARTTVYTVEGDPIITDFTYDGQGFAVTRDTTRDKFGSGNVSSASYANLVSYTPYAMSDTAQFWVTNLEEITPEDLYNGIDGVLLFSVTS